MVETTLVDAALRLVADLERRYGSIDVAALLPTDDEEDSESRPLILFLAAGWVDEETFRDRLLAVIAHLDRMLDVPQSMQISRVVLVQPGEDTAEGIRRRYRGQILPARITEGSVGARSTLNGVVLQVRSRSVPPYALRGRARSFQMHVDDRLSFDEMAYQNAHRPVSERRVEEFRQSLTADRSRAATLEEILGRLGLYETAAPGAVSIEPVGFFRQLIGRGPFVEESNWAPLSTWTFAAALERHLLTRLFQLCEPGEQVGAVEGWDDALRSLQPHGGVGRDWAYLLSGDVDPEVSAAVVKVNPRDWWLDPLSNKPWLMGEHAGSPIVRIPDASGTATVTKVSLLQFRLTRVLSPDGGLLDCTVRDLTSDEREELVVNEALWRNKRWSRIDPALRRDYLQGRVELNVGERVRLETIMPQVRSASVLVR